MKRSHVSVSRASSSHSTFQKHNHLPGDRRLATLTNFPKQGFPHFGQAAMTQSGIRRRIMTCANTTAIKGYHLHSPIRIGPSKCGPGVGNPGQDVVAFTSDSVRRQVSTSARIPSTTDLTTKFRPVWRWRNTGSCRGLIERKDRIAISVW